MIRIFSILIISATLLGCANSDQVNQLKSDTVQLNNAYENNIIKKAQNATCHDLKNKYKSEYDIGCYDSGKQTGDVLAYPYVIRSNFGSNDGKSYYDRYIIKRLYNKSTKKWVENKRFHLNKKESEALQRILLDFDSFMLKNLENYRSRYESGLKFKEFDFVTKLIADNRGVVPSKYINSERITNSINDFYTRTYRGFFNNFKDEIKFVWKRVDSTQGNKLFIDSLYKTLKTKALVAAHLPVEAKYCDEENLSFKLCEFAGNPLNYKRVFKDSRVEFLVYYSYGGNPYGHVVEVNNKTDHYLNVSNIDMLIRGKYYSAQVNGDAVPPKSTKKFKVDTPRGVSGYFTTNDPKKFITYGVVSRYIVNGKTYTFNQERNYTPFDEISE